MRRGDRPRKKDPPPSSIEMEDRRCRERRPSMIHGVQVPDFGKGAKFWGLAARGHPGSCATTEDRGPRGATDSAEGGAPTS